MGGDCIGLHNPPNLGPLRSASDQKSRGAVRAPTNVRLPLSTSTGVRERRADEKEIVPLIFACGGLGDKNLAFEVPGPSTRLYQLGLQVPFSSNDPGPLQRPEDQLEAVQQGEIPLGQPLVSPEVDGDEVHPSFLHPSQPGVV